MKKIGELLSSEREKKGLSLHEIGMALKINPKILKAIEEADPQGLPAKTFLRGFVRSYAQFLHLDVNMVMKMFQEEMGSTRPEEPKATAEAPAPSETKPQLSIVTEKPAPEKIEVKKTLEEKPAPAKSGSASAATKSKAAPPRQTESSLSSPTVYKIIGSLVLVLLIVFVARMVDKYQKESQRIKVEATNPIVATDEKAEASGPVQIATPAAAVSGESAPMTPISPNTSADVKIAAKTATLPTAVATPAPTATPINANSVVAKATPMASPTRVMAPTPTPLQTAAKATPTPSAVVAVSSPSPTPTATPTPQIAGKPTEVIVEALNNVQIKYSLGDDKWETLSMMGDELHTFKSKANMVLEVSDGGAVNIIVNGRDRGVPGTIGKPIKLSYPK